MRILKLLISLLVIFISSEKQKDEDTKGTWQRSPGGIDDDLAYYIQKTNDGGYIIAGSSKSNDGEVSVIP